MKRSHIVILSLVALVCAVFLVNEAAEAASRMGGGKSFGSQRDSNPMQRDAARRLRFSAKKIMMLAQQLYAEGWSQN